MTDLNDISTDDLVVVMDLGTSLFRAAAGVRTHDENGNVCVELLCYNSEPAQGVKRGRVYNLETSAFAIKSLLMGLENQLNKLLNEDRKQENRIKYKIKRVCVGLNGKSIKTVENKVLKSLGSNQEEVTTELMEDLYNEAKGIRLTDDAEILKVVQQEFLIDDEEEELNPKGCLAYRISGRYKIVSGSVSLRRNLKNSVERAGYELAETPLAIEATAMSVLSLEERQTGCAIFDFGAGTTSVAVYNKNVLRDLFVAPYGGNVVTSDIASLKIPEYVAETLKKKHGSTMQELAMDADIDIPNGPTVNAKFLADVIGCRMDEIICSIWKDLERNYSLRHINEIVLTGNASLLGHLKHKMTLLTGVDVRIGKPTYGHVLVEPGFKQNAGLSQLLGLMEFCESECVFDVTHEPERPKKAAPKVTKKQDDGEKPAFWNKLKSLSSVMESMANSVLKE